MAEGNDTMRNFKLMGILFGVALATTLVAKTIEMMGARIDKKELAKDVVEDVADHVTSEV